MTWKERWENFKDQLVHPSDEREPLGGEAPRREAGAAAGHKSDLSSGSETLDD